LTSFELSVARLAVWFVVLVLIFSPLEFLFARRRQKFFHKGLAQDLGYYVINGLLTGLLLAVPLSFVASVAHAIVPYRIQVATADWTVWQRILAGLVIGEIGFYWAHRWMHVVPFLWRFHSIHHSAEHVYFLVSARAHPFDEIFIRVCGMIPVYLLGVASPLTRNGSAVTALIVIIARMWGFFVHSNVRWRLGPLEWLISTPGFHHWHHTLGGLRDRNYASVLPWVDIIFGTYHAPWKESPAAYGIETKLPASLAHQLVYPFLPQPPPASSPQPVAANQQ
jgi:sterol desaturase/sphingolipid hydroxylase (fatty acid hydroxylase superfamily)